MEGGEQAMGDAMITQMNNDSLRFVIEGVMTDVRALAKATLCNRVKASRKGRHSD